MEQSSWILTICGVLCLLSGAAHAQTRVVDGDTLEINGTVYRLNGIDAPEAGQQCKKPSGASWHCGQASIDAMAELSAGKTVRCEGTKSDGYGRTIGTCFADGIDLGAEMVRTGNAWAFVKYSEVYVQQERQAREERLGVWQGPAVAPWDYRAALWESATQEAPKGCPIKGNISQNGRIYHPPWSPWYKRTKINTAKGEHWFCSEAEAIEAGWRAPRWR